MKDNSIIKPEEVAPVMASPEDSLLDNWPILFRAGVSVEDNNMWGLSTENVQASRLLEYAFPSDAKSDAQFIAWLINAYRTGKVVLKDENQG